MHPFINIWTEKQLISRKKDNYYRSSSFSFFVETLIFRALLIVLSYLHMGLFNCILLVETLYKTFKKSAISIIFIDSSGTRFGLVWFCFCIRRMVPFFYCEQP